MSLGNKSVDLNFENIEIVSEYFQSNYHLVNLNNHLKVCLFVCLFFFFRTLCSELLKLERAQESVWATLLQCLINVELTMILH